MLPVASEEVVMGPKVSSESDLILRQGQPADAVQGSLLASRQRRMERLPVTGPAGRLIGIVSHTDVLKVFLRSDVDDVSSLPSTVGHWLP